MCCLVLAVVSMAILDPLIDRDPLNVDIENGKIVEFHDYDKNVSFDILISYGSWVTTIIPWLWCSRVTVIMPCLWYILEVRRYIQLKEQSDYTRTTVQT